MTLFNFCMKPRKSEERLCSKKVYLNSVDPTILRQEYIHSEFVSQKTSSLVCMKPKLEPSSGNTTFLDLGYSIIGHKASLDHRPIRKLALCNRFSKVLAFSYFQLTSAIFSLCDGCRKQTLKR